MIATTLVMVQLLSGRSARVAGRLWPVASASAATATRKSSVPVNWPVARKAEGAHLPERAGMSLERRAGASAVAFNDLEHDCALARRRPRHESQLRQDLDLVVVEVN